jgi:sigma-B regulation protein RsbU (phosphoserine phosphatase)
MTTVRIETVAASAEGDLQDFFEAALCGYLWVDPNGRIVRGNARVNTWLGEGELAGKKFSDCLTIAGKIYYETHLAPLLRMQGFFDEVALELACAGGKRMPVFVNALERRGQGGTHALVTIFKAADRHQYEKNLLASRSAAVSDNEKLRETAALREQFVAILGHDLRNPLAAIDSGMRLLERTPLNEKALAVTSLIHQSVGRMARLIEDMMDFARARLGGGLSLIRRPALLAPVLEHAIAELRIGALDRVIEAEFLFPVPVYCDANRVAQVVSNLVANALTHGAAHGPIFVQGGLTENDCEISVRNTGAKISPEALERLFQPFQREDVAPSKQGLGLGLYIASEVAQAHGGTISVTSTEAETCFVLKIPRVAEAGS